MKRIENLVDEMRGGELVFLAGRERVGKTRFALDVVNYLTMGKGVACFYHIEGEIGEEIEEMLIEIGGDGTYEALRDSKLPLYMNDDIWLGRLDIYDMIREHKKKYDIQLAVIDDFYGMTGYLMPEFGEQALIETAESLKKLAVELDIPIMVIHSLAGDIDKFSDLGVVQDWGDKILFLHREGDYDVRRPKPGAAEIIVAKNENGDVGTIELCFASGRFFQPSRKVRKSATAKKRNVIQ